MIAPGVAVVLLSTAVGMLGLFGVRDILGPWGYRLSAFPVGLLVWPFIILFTTLTGTIMLWRTVLPVMMVYVLVLLLLGRALRTKPVPRPSTKGLLGDAVFFGLVAVVAGMAAAAGISITTADSWSNYAIMGYWLRDTGELTPFIFAHRGILIPSVHAADVFLGGSWPHVVYPVMGASVVGLLAYALWNTAFSGLKQQTRALATAGVVALMVTTAPFVLHSAYMHSHMITAMYLLFAAVALERATAVTSKAGSDGPGRDAAAWSLVAGLATLGVVYARPDGLAYSTVVFALVAVLLWSGRLGRWATTTYFATLLSGSAILLSLLVYENGLYSILRRLSALENLAMLGGLLILAVLILGLERFEPLASRLKRPGVALGVVAVADALLLAAVAVYATEGLGTALGFAWGNLFFGGYFNLLWWWAAGVVIAGVLMSALGPRRPWLPFVLLVVVQFFVIGFVVHGLLHPGREGWSDSFTRVVFHIVPVVFWLFGVEFGAAAQELQESETTSAAVAPAE